MADNSSKKTITLDNLDTFYNCLKSEKGKPNGFASLDSDGKIPTSQLSEDVADITVTANEFDPTIPYNVGDYVIYEGDLYICTTNHSAGAWDVTHFTLTSITNELDERQPKTLDTPIVVDGTTYTTLETAINAINNTTVKNSDIGVVNGVAELDSAGKVPSSQLPSYVDDVLEYASISVFPAIGESGKIYVTLDTNKTYRWGGTDYVEISESLALGRTSSTAFPGDAGKAIEDKIPSNASSSNQLATKADIPTVAYPVNSVNGKTGVVTLNNTDVGAAATSHTHTKSQITDFPSSMPASDVYAWAKASTKPSYTASEVGAIATSAKGAANGVASLGSDGKVPSSQLPSSTGESLTFNVPSGSTRADVLSLIYSKINGSKLKIGSRMVFTRSNGTYEWLCTRFEYYNNSYYYSFSIVSGWGTGTSTEILCFNPTSSTSVYSSIEKSNDVVTPYLLTNYSFSIPTKITVYY